ncbi:dihydrofolate reductase family protein, partial [Vibrio parahaemolyticus]
ARGVTRLLVEGGPQVWRAFAEAGQVDEVVLFVAGAALLGADEVIGYARRHLGALPLAVAGYRTLGADGMWRLTVSTGAGAATHSS